MFDFIITYVIIKSNTNNVQRRCTMDNIYVEVILNECSIEMAGCPNGCQRSTGSPTGG